MSTTSIEHIGSLTGNFDEQNLIAEFQFGKLYLVEYEDIRGTKIRKTVKIWDDKSEANRGRFLDEIYLLQHEQCSKHPGFMTLKKFACREDDDKLGAVYADAPLDILYNLVEKDSFTWLHRIKAALGIASVLRFLHADDPPYEPYLVRNLDAAHILIDEGHNAKLLDFGRISGGMFPNAPYPVESSSRKYGYVDPFNHEDEWSKKSDVLHSASYS